MASGSTSPTSTLPLRSSVARRSGEWRKMRAASARIRNAIHAHVDDHRPMADVFGRQHGGPSHGGHQDLAFAADGGRSTVREWQMVTVACACSSSSAMGLPTISLRPTTTARLPATGISYCRRSSMMPAGVHGTRSGPTRHQVADVHRMESVDVFVRRDRQQHAARIHLRRQRQLHQDAVDIGPLVQAVDEREQLFGGDGGGRRKGLARDAQFGAGLHLVAHVDLGSGIVADQHDGQSRRARGRGQRCHARPQIAQDLVADAVSIKDCGHL